MLAYFLIGMGIGICLTCMVVAAVLEIILNQNGRD